MSPPPTPVHLTPPATPTFRFPSPIKAQCTPELWTLAACCSPGHASHTDLRKWEQLLTGYGGLTALMTPRPWQVGHVHLVEPLSVAAFISAIQDWKKRAGSGRGFVLDIGMNVGFYTWLASAMAPGLVGLIGVDMQPKCVEVAECGLRLLHHSSKHATAPPLDFNRVQLLRRYVSNSSDQAALHVPANQCGVTVSPTSTDGLSSAFAGRRKKAPSAAEHAAKYATALPVRPIALGQHLLQQFGSDARAAVVKIDTEGAFPLAKPSRSSLFQRYYSAASSHSRLAVARRL